MADAGGWGRPGEQFIFQLALPGRLFFGRRTATKVKVGLLVTSLSSAGTCFNSCISFFIQHLS
jgi:hypothetical protein